MPTMIHSLDSPPIISNVLRCMHRVSVVGSALDGTDDGADDGVAAGASGGGYA